MTDAILGLLSRFRREMPDTLGTQELLKLCAERTTETLPFINVVTFYQVVRGGLTVWHTSQRDDTAFISLSKVPQYQRVLETGEVDYAHPLIIFGLRSISKPFGLLELRVDSGHTLTSDEIDSLSLIAQQVALWLDNAVLRDLLQRQVEASKQLSNCDNLAQVAAVLARTFHQPGQFVSVNVFETNEKNEITGVRVVGTANATQVYETDDVFALGKDITNVQNTLIIQDELLIADVDTDVFSESARQLLQKVKIKSAYLVALKAEGQIVGFISFNDTQRSIVLTESERTVYRSLAEQASIVIERRNLLEQMLESISELQTLYEISSALTFALDLPQILGVIYGIFRQGLRSLNLLDISYDSRGLPTQFLLRYIVQGNGEVQETNRVLYEGATPEQLEGILQIMQESGGQIEIFEDIENELEVTNRAMFLADGIKSAATIPLFDEGMRVSQLSLTYNEPRKFSESERRLLNNIQAELTLVLQNRRLISETQKAALRSEEQVRLLSILNDITNAANVQQDEAQLLSYAVKALQEATKTDHVAISLSDETGSLARVTAEYPQFGHVGTLITPDDSLNAYLREQRRVFIARDLEKTNELDEKTRNQLLLIGIKGLFVVPMFNSQKQLIGSVSFNMMKPIQAFDEQLVELGYTIVSQLSLSLQKLRLYADSQRQATQIQRINAFGQSVQATQDLSTILGYAMDTLQTITRYDYAAVYVYDRQHHVLGMMSRSQHGDTTIFDAPQPVKEGVNTLISQVWSDYEAQQVNDLDANTLWNHPLRGVIRSVIALPLMSSGRSFGVLEVAQNIPSAYSLADMGVVRQMANQMAVALDNADALVRSQQQTRIKSRANEITAQLQQQIDMESMLRVTVQEVGRALGAKRARIRLATSIDSPKQET